MAAKKKPAKAKPPKKGSAARRSTNTRRDWKPAFLEAFRETGVVSYACERAGVGRRTVYEARQRDEEFAVAWAEVELLSTEAMEAEAFRRGVRGVKKPVYQGGIKVGEVREYSDTLLIFMLKARKPETYRERFDHRHSGGIGGPAPPPEGVDLRKLSDEELAAFRKLTEKASATDD